MSRWLIDADALGQADASVAWNFANLASHHWMLGMFDKRARIWSGTRTLTSDCLLLHLSGRSRQKSRRWICVARQAGLSPRGDSSEWKCLPALFRSTTKADGIEYRSFCLNKSDYKIKDTWNSAGLRGTGSKTSKSRDAFVAGADDDRRRSDLAGGPTPGSAVNPNALYALPASLFHMCFPERPLGMRSACLDDYVDVARHRASTIIAPGSPTCRVPDQDMPKLPRRSMRRA